jgi:hypothetical protein
MSQTAVARIKIGKVAVQPRRIAATDAEGEAAQLPFNQSNHRHADFQYSVVFGY